MPDLKAPAAGGLLAALCVIGVTSWALAQEGLIVDLGALHLLPPQTSIQEPDVQVTRSLILRTGESDVPILFSVSESDGTCPFSDTDFPWIEVFSDAEVEHLDGRILGSFESGETPRLDLVFDSSGLSPGDFFSATLCVEFQQDFTGFDPPPPVVAPTPEALSVSIQVIQPVEDVPILSVWSLILMGVLFLCWGMHRLL